jgi:threonine/homoserine/homoserine lactone efflux protein
MACALGLGLGATIFGVLALLGLQGVLARVPELYLALKVLGGAYLLYLAWRIVRGARTPLPEPGELMGTIGADGGRGAGWLAALGSGLAVQLSNPKTALVFAGIFAALMPAAPPLWVSALLLGLILLQETLWYVLVALVFSTGRARAVHARFKHWIDRVAGVVIGALGVRLIWDALRAR